MRVKFLAQGAFEGARTHDWQVSTDHESDALTTALATLATNDSNV